MNDKDVARGQVRENLQRVRERIEAAATRSGRDPASVRIVAVTKGHPVSAVRAAVAAGVLDLGENRVEEMVWKVSECGDLADVRWHMIGHIQSRKASRAANLSDLVHSVDSMRLATKLGRIGDATGQPIPVLIQINASGEATKGGFAARRALDDIKAVAACSGLRVKGLMTMAPFTDDEAVLRSTFRRVRGIMADATAIPGVVGCELSMGMSNDFEIAVSEGATLLRLGTVLLGPRPG